MTMMTMMTMLRRADERLRAHGMQNSTVRCLSSTAGMICVALPLRRYDAFDVGLSTIDPAISRPHDRVAY